MINKVRDCFWPMWLIMGPLQKIKAIWLFYRWRSAEMLSDWLHKHYDRLWAGKDGRK